VWPTRRVIELVGILAYCQPEDPEEMVIVSPIAAPTQVRRTPKRQRLSFLHRGLVVVASGSLIVGYQ
jgi:hypothetical protein